MSILEIKKYPDKILSRKASEVEVITPQIERLTDSMIRTMYTASGVGLAGPQVGQCIKVFVVDPNPEGKTPLIFINPEIIEKKGKVISEEGCLSLPGLNAKVNRAERVVLRARDIKGKQIEIEADGLLSRIIQHEVDHLNGVLFVDRLSFLKKRWTLRGYKSR